MWNFFFPPEFREHISQNRATYCFYGVLMIGGIVLVLMEIQGK